MDKLLVIGIDKNKIYEMNSVSQTKKILTSLTIPEYPLNSLVNQKILPLTINNSKITSIDVTIDGIKTNFLDLIKHNVMISKSNKDTLTEFYSGWIFIYVTSDTDYIYAERFINNNWEKRKYSLSGVLITKVIDKSDVHGNVYRQIGETVIHINNNKLISISKEIKLTHLPKPKLKHLWVPNIGVIDLETCIDKDNKSLCIRFYN